MFPFRIFWKSIGRRPAGNLPEPKFVDLAPTEDADHAEIYFKALQYAFSNDGVLNIAITGPYGSGKSSVIRSFLKKHPERRSLQVSLASFSPELGASQQNAGVVASKVGHGRPDIERSILQQILYGVEAGKLPLSRFKRIRTPKRKAAAISLFMGVGVASLWYLLSRQGDILSGAFFKPFEFSNWFNFLSATLAAAFVWAVVHSAYMKSFGLSLKSISLKDVQIAPDAESEGSILNRHLDEIIYFFQSTKYDLVIIEDLDRFNDTEIFVTLREINGLINANEAIKRRVRFIYAIKDDIFANTDRTKFFEFIVPIIPVINHLNSIDKVVEHGQRIELDSRLNRQFVRDVSRYLSDLRLIRNIFNEYVVYSANLRADEDGGLDPNKLLAILIYKNVFPRDFAALHRQEGVLTKIFGRYDRYISTIESELRAEINAIEANLASGEAQSLRDEAELRRVYAMAVIERVPANYTSLQVGSEELHLGKLAVSPELEKILARSSVNASGLHGRSTIVDTKGIEASVDPTRTFADRREEIGRKSASFKQSSAKRLGDLKRQLASLRTRKFNEVVRENAELIDEVFAEAGENLDLLKFLTLEGYLDDTYYQYTSLFHSGRLSPNDNKFLIQIRGYKNPSPEFPIDNAAEVIASMREEDFGNEYVLNRVIVDHLLEVGGTGSPRVAAACEFIATHFEECGEFFRVYYATGLRVDRLVAMLAEQWTEFAPHALGSVDAVAHAARMLAYVPENLLEKPPFAKGPLAEFISKSIAHVLVEQVAFDLVRLIVLDVRVVDVPSIAGHADVVSFIAAAGLYEITPPNIRHVLEHVIHWQSVGDLDTRHFSTLLKTRDEALLKRVNDDFEPYVRNVLLAIPTNNAEELLAILQVLGHEEVEQELLEAFLKMQTAVFSSFDGVPDKFHALLLTEQKIEATWGNCEAFLLSDGYDDKLLTEYLNTPSTIAALSRSPLQSSESASVLRDFVVENDELEVSAYRSYIRTLPHRLPSFPDVDDQKIAALIEERKVMFSVESFDQLQEDLQVLFLAKNIEAYLSDPDEYSVEDGLRAKLLKTNIKDEHKLVLIADMDSAFVVGDAGAAAAIGAVLDRSAIDTSTYDAQFIASVILHSSPPRRQISLFNKLQAPLSRVEVREVLKDLPRPYCEIATYGKLPKIEKTEVNEEFASWLQQRGIISSYSETFLGDIRINTFKKGN